VSLHLNTTYFSSTIPTSETGCSRPHLNTMSSSSTIPTSETGCSPPHLNTTSYSSTIPTSETVCVFKPQHHVFFVHHSDQRDWVFGVMERLELQSASPGGFRGLRCTSLSQIAAAQRNISLFQALYHSDHEVIGVHCDYRPLYVCIFVHLSKIGSS